MLDVQSGVAHSPPRLLNRSTQVRLSHALSGLDRGFLHCPLLTITRCLRGTLRRAWLVTPRDSRKKKATTSMKKRKSGVGEGKGRERDRLFERVKGNVRKDVALHNQLAPPVAAKIAKALRHGGRLSKAEAEEAAFHLTDWIVDLHELNELFSAPRWNYARAQRVLTSFVAHVPAHLAAAYRTIMGDPLTDVFEIGAVKGRGRGTRMPGAPYARRNIQSPAR
jgi:hypothetical protein